MRMDARRNAERLLDAARDAYVEQGADAALEEIARRAGVGIATLYRRFGSGSALQHAVVHSALAATAEAAARALREHDDPFEALTAYVHAVIDLRTAAVIPALLGRLDLTDAELAAARRLAARRVGRIVTAAHRAGQLDEHVTFTDISLMLVRLARPLPGPIPGALQTELAHRHAELYLRGMRTAAPGTSTPPGPALRLADLHRLQRSTVS
jgi:AcrR family transcriptional regulator